MISIDTIVVPATEEHFRDVFLGQNRWYGIRIAPEKQAQLKYIAVYRSAPISAITHIATISCIESQRDTTEKCVIRFVGHADRIGPIPLIKGGRVKPFSNLRYAARSKLESAATIDDIWED